MDKKKTKKIEHGIRLLEIVGASAVSLRDEMGLSKGRWHKISTSAWVKGGLINDAHVTAIQADSLPLPKKSKKK